jgi:hypothetical protein
MERHPEMYNHESRLLSSSRIIPPGGYLTSSSSSQALPHKPPLAKAQPPLARLPSPIRIKPRNQSHRQLLTHLRNVLSQGIGLVSVSRRLIKSIQRERGVTRQSEVVQRGGIECLFFCFLFFPISPNPNISPNPIHWEGEEVCVCVCVYVFVPFQHPSGS